MLFSRHTELKYNQVPSAKKQNQLRNFWTIGRGLPFLPFTVHNRCGGVSKPIGECGYRSAARSKQQYPHKGVHSEQGSITAVTGSQQRFIFCYETHPIKSIIQTAYSVVCSWHLSPFHPVKLGTLRVSEGKLARQQCTKIHGWQPNKRCAYKPENTCHSFTDLLQDIRVRDISIHRPACGMKTCHSFSDLLYEDTRVDIFIHRHARAAVCRQPQYWLAAQQFYRGATCLQMAQPTCVL